MTSADKICDIFAQARPIVLGGGAPGRLLDPSMVTVVQEVQDQGPQLGGQHGPGVSFIGYFADQLETRKINMTNFHVSRHLPLQMSLDHRTRSLGLSYGLRAKGVETDLLKSSKSGLRRYVWRRK